MQLGAHHRGTMAALILTLGLASCSTEVFDTNERWFSRPFDVTGRSGGYTYSELQESSRNRPIGANDLIDASGACPPVPAPAAAQGPGVMPTAPAETPSLLGGGVALGMSECDVVYRAGAPQSVQVGKNSNGARTVVLTYNSGPRPGIYHFEDGRLMDMDRVQVAEPAATPKAKAAAKKKKRPAHPEQVSTQ